MNKKSLGNYIDVLRFALIRAEWYEDDSEGGLSRDRWLNESIQALESTLIMFKNARDINQQEDYVPTNL
tara:strand:- start:4445 stop:4651 length:207 start_codon:yes stop_codon:yes gene_type:complete